MATETLKKPSTAPPYWTNYVVPDARLTAMRTMYAIYVEDERFIRHMPAGGALTGTEAEWESLAVEGMPGYVINAKFGACLIWGRRWVTTDIARMYYLITLVRPTAAMNDKGVKELNKMIKKKRKEPILMPPKRLYPRGIGGTYGYFDMPAPPPEEIVPGDYYEVPAIIILPNGSAITFCFPLNYLIMDIKFANADGTGTKLVEVKGAEGIEVMTLDEFNTIRSAEPKLPKTLGYMYAMAAFQRTNPTIHSRFMLATKRVYSEGARKNLLFTPPIASQIFSKQDAFHPVLAD